MNRRDTLLCDLSRVEGPGLAPQLDEQVIERLRAEYWIETVGELLQTLAVGTFEPGFEASFGLPRDALDALARRLQAGLPPEEAAALQSAFNFPTGALLDEPPAQAVRGLTRAVEWESALPGSCSIIEQMSEVVDQGSRGTCVSCAATALNEWLARRRAGAVSLSIQHLYWACKERDGHPGQGTWLSTAVNVLRDAGQCRAATWPYDPSWRPDNEGQGPPPPQAKQEALFHRAGPFDSVAGSQIVDLKRLLAGGRCSGREIPGRPVLFGIPLFPSFKGGETARSGKILVPLPGQRPLGGHAMVIVGYRDGSAPGGGYFIVRNSWGLGWGQENTDGAGHGHLPYAYLEQHGRALSYTFASVADAARVTRDHQAKQQWPVAVPPPLTDESPGGDCEESIALGHRVDNGAPLVLPVSALGRHLIALGKTRSGKTVLCKLICERALRLGIPVIAIDPQGDLASMAAPLSSSVANINDGGGDKPAIDPVIFTPLSSKGVPICADPFATLKTCADDADPIENTRRIERVAAIFAGCLDGLGKQRRPLYVAALTACIRHGISSGRLNGFDDLAEVVLEPPAELEEVLTGLVGQNGTQTLQRSVRAMQLGSARFMFDHGAPLDIDLLIGRREGRVGMTQLSILYLNTLNTAAEKEAFVGLLAEALHAWMLRNPPSRLGKPQLLLFIDEIGQFVPNPTQRKPVCKDMLTMIFKQAGKYGVACLGASQSPADFDYRVLGQATSTCIGRMSTPQELGQVRRLLEADDADRLEQEVVRLPVGEFFLFSPDVSPRAIRFRADMTSFDLSTLTDDGVAELTSPELRRRFTMKSERSPGGAAVASGDRIAAVASASAVVNGPLPHGELPDLHLAVLGLLAASPAAMTIDELKAGWEDSDALKAQQATDLLPALRAAVSNGSIQQHSVNGARRFSVPEQGLLPAAGLFGPVLYPAVMPVSAAKAGRLFGRLAGAGWLAARQTRLQDLGLLSYPLWRVVAAIEVETWFGMGRQRTESILYVDGITQQLLISTDGEMRFGTSLEEPLENHSTDPLRRARLAPTAPENAAVLPPNYRDLVGGPAISRMVSRRFGAEVLSCQAVFLPIWVGRAERQLSKSAPVRFVDALLGGEFLPPCSPDLRCLPRA